MAVVRYRYSWHATSEPIITTRTSRMTSKATLATNMDDTECKEGDRLSLSIGAKKEGLLNKFLTSKSTTGLRFRTQVAYSSLPVLERASNSNGFPPRRDLSYDRYL